MKSTGNVYGDIYSLDLHDSGEYANQLWEQYQTASKKEKKQIKARYEMVAAYHNKLAGFKRLYRSIQ